MTDLIRLHDGQETPGPGRWIVAPGHPVHVNVGSWGRQRSTAHTIAGSLLITDAGAMAFRLIIDWSDIPGRASTTLKYQSITIDAGSPDGHWVVEGEVLVAGRLLSARSNLQYHGVFRSPLRVLDGAGAIARLGWQLTFGRIPGSPRGAPRRHALSADLSAHAPQFPAESPS